MIGIIVIIFTMYVYVYIYVDIYAIINDNVVIDDYKVSIKISL